MGTLDRIFGSWKLGSLDVPNRLVRSATMEGLATADGAPTPRLRDLLVDLARGGVGLIILGSAHTSVEGRYATNESGLHRDELIAPMSRLCTAVHGAGGLIAAQLCHSGSTIPPGIVTEKEGPYGPSAVELDPVCGAPVRALTATQIAEIIEEFARAARRARRAGFDAVQIHAAHGYLIDQFLSPARNRRDNLYGGSLAGRAHLLTEIHEAVRGAVGADFPVLVKLSAHDGFAEGLQPADAVQVAAELDAQGIDAIEVSAGTPEGAVRGGWDHIGPAPIVEGRFFEYALAIKAAVSCPVLSVEGWRDPRTIANALKRIDAVSMSRPFIREPHLVARWRAGDLAPSTCTSCNRCLDSLTSAQGLKCIFDERDQMLGEQHRADESARREA